VLAPRRSPATQSISHGEVHLSIHRRRGRQRQCYHYQLSVAGAGREQPLRAAARRRRWAARRSRPTWLTFPNPSLYHPHATAANLARMPHSNHQCPSSLKCRNTDNEWDKCLVKTRKILRASGSRHRKQTAKNLMSINSVSRYALL